MVIGKDTRLSGYMIESALVSGFTAVGMDVFQFGPLPTPAVAMLTRSLARRSGVMITASHNPYQDNGIKFFGPDGQKLSDAVELEIEQLMDGGLEAGLATGGSIGRAKRIDDSQARYIEFAKRTFPRNLRLDGLAHRDRLRPWRRLQGGAGSVVGIGRRHRAAGRVAGRHSTSTWNAARPRPRRCAPRCAKCAPISASRWTATPTGW